ncbi:MAG: hypothetical protein LBV49_12265, partial [Azonexus sp.]|nr:hypothetical protein [Azonexus sp.]
MWDSLFPAEFEASANAMLYRQPEAPPEPGTWQNFGSALVDMVPSAIHSTLSAVSGVIETASGPMAYANAGTIAYMQGKAPPDEKTLRAETIGKMWNTGEAVDFFRSQAKSYTPDPMSVGMAG